MLLNYSNILQCLSDLGMSERESKLYIAMLKKNHATATELQKLSGVPLNKVYESLGGLVRKGYCLERKTGRRRTFEVLDPEVTLNGAFKNLETRLNDSLSSRDKILNLYHAAETQSEPLEFIESLHGNENIHHRYIELVKNVKEELLGFGRGPYACDTNERLEQQLDQYYKILKRGIKMRWVYELQIPDNQWLLGVIDDLEKKGSPHRIINNLPLKMMIFDRKTLLIAEEEPLHESGQLTMSIIKHNTVVKAFCALFEYFWDQATDFKKWNIEKKLIKEEAD